ncbi:TPA: hypothetical protein QEL15_001008 [Stenotrophomonas maltophilia]|nr:hypothetical protein [Stenotrophomonas maltophilia]
MPSWQRAFLDPMNGNGAGTPRRFPLAALSIVVSNWISLARLFLRSRLKRIFLLRKSERLMHDWTLLEIRVDWAAGSAQLILLDERSLSRSILFSGLREFSPDR